MIFLDVTHNEINSCMLLRLCESQEEKFQWEELHSVSGEGWENCGYLCHPTWLTEGPESKTG